MTLGYFVTGTDTEVGKTLVSCALLLHLRTQHRRVVGMKPVAAGTMDRGGDNEDVVALRAASSIRVPRELDNPYGLSRPMSPHLAARLDGQHIDVALLAERYRQLAAQADAVVVEGAGGFLVPLNDTHSGADLALVLQLPVLLVVTQFLTQKMTPTPGVDPSQQKMMMITPLIFGYIFYFLSSGLVLYYLTSNFVAIARQMILNRISGPITPAVIDVKSTPSQNQAKKRRS